MIGKKKHDTSIWDYRRAEVPPATRTHDDRDQLFTGDCRYLLSFIVLV